MLTQAPSRRSRLAAVLDLIATPHGIDRYLELVSPTWSLHEVRATVTAVSRAVPGSVTLTLRPNRNWQGFRAGQHVLLGVEIDGVRHTRCYSPANAEHDRREIELTVKRHPEGRVSPWLHANARPGLVVDLSPARGDFTLPPHRPARTLLVSGGSGITPVMSMLRTLCAEAHDGPVTLLHYSPTPGNMPYGPELEARAADCPNVRLVRAYSEDPGAGELTGSFSRDHLAAAEPAYAVAETYVCGPGSLMQAVRAVFEDEGLGDRLHTEAFTLPEYEVQVGPTTAGTLRCARSGVEMVGDGRTLLEQAEAAGLSPRSGCRMGICRTCTTKMAAGTVRNVITGETTTGTDVDVQLCTSVPVGDVTIEL